MLRKAAILESLGFHKSANIYKGVSKKEKMPDEFILDSTVDDVANAVSKFVEKGLRLVEFGLPEWENEANKSVRFPFIVIEEGSENGKEGKVVTGLDKKSAWKHRQLMEAGVVIFKDKDGKASFDPNEVVGKQAKIYFREQKDTRSVEEGGTGTVYTKPDNVYPADLTEADLGI